MSTETEKDRISDEIVRSGPDEPVLPLVNPAAEKSEPVKSAAFHPAVYVMYVITRATSHLSPHDWKLT